MYTPRPQLGTRHACAACPVKFYDLGRSPAACPVCGTAPPPRRPPSARLPAGRRWSTTPAPIAEAAAEPALLEAAEGAEDADEVEDDADDTNETEIDLPDDAGEL